jgi:hypothetical protein
MYEGGSRGRDWPQVEMQAGRLLPPFRIIPPKWARFCNPAGRLDGGRRATVHRLFGCLCAINGDQGALRHLNDTNPRMDALVDYPKTSILIGHNEGRWL